jgi:hypothetical protein
VKPYIEEAHRLAGLEKFDDCAQILIDNLIRQKPRVPPGEGLQYLTQLIPGMISRGMRLEVAHILWGHTQFNAEPESVRLIWDEVKKTATMLVPGAGALGKSYSLAVYFLLDWIEDPLYTAIKVVAPTAEHAKRNVFAHIKNLHRNSTIPLPGQVREGSIQASSDDKQGIHLVSIPIGEDGAGRLQGMHPTPRKRAHPIYGSLSRIRVILDDAQEIPGGIWDDIDNMLITLDGIEHVKITAAANPRDVDSKFGRRCEPEDGWSTLDIETSITWKSKLGWAVVRLDGARCENVVQKRMVYAGLLSYEGYRRYLLQGDTSPEYYTMARGFFPVKGLTINVIPREFMEKATARLNFTGRVTYCAAVDLAFEGDDTAPMTVGRFGLATGYSFLTPEGPKTVNFERAKYALQAESQFDLIKNDPSKQMMQTVWLAHQIRTHCLRLGIPGRWVIVDRTGNGTGVHDILKSPSPTGLGEDVVGVHYGAAATDKKLFAESTELASDLYDGLVTELFFATRNFLEFDYLKISPSLDIAALTEELCTRRFKPGTRSGKVRVEGKKEYKARGNKSPDKADSITLLVHLVRLREGFEAMLLSTTESVRDQEIEPGIVDRLQYMDWGN